VISSGFIRFLAEWAIRRGQVLSNFSARPAFRRRKTMTLQELLARIEGNPVPVLAYFTASPVVAWLAGHLHPKGSVYDSPVRYVYTIVIYMVCLPGLLAAVALGDSLARGQLMDVGVLSQILPLLAMLITFGIVRHQANPEHIPGFSRITGFMLLLVLTAAGIFLLMKTHIWIFFGGGMGTLLVSMAVLFLLLKWAFDRTFGAGR
jgi:hypothetical protein